MWSEWINTVCQTLRYNGRVEGNRVKGRHKKRWLDNVIDDCYHRGWSIVEATRLATDRQRWRTYIRLSLCHSVPRHRHDNKKKREDFRPKLLTVQRHVTSLPISQKIDVVPNVSQSEHRGKFPQHHAVEFRVGGGWARGGLGDPSWGD